MSSNYIRLFEKICNSIPSQKDLVEVTQELGAFYGDFLAKAIHLSWANIQFEEQNSKMLREHGNSLALIIENESKNIQLEELNQKLSEAYKALEAESKVDYLTSLYNRKTILELFGSECKRMSRQKDKLARFMKSNQTSRESENLMGNLSCAIIDIDFFKKINDLYGHLVGDEVLIEVSKIISTNIRSSDFIGRIGGEEFLLLLTDTNSDNAKIAVQKILTKVAEHIFNMPDFAPFQVTLTAGITQYSKADLKIDEAIQRADQALYYGKQNGRNQVQIYDNSIMKKLSHINLEQANTIIISLNSSLEILTQIRNVLRARVSLFNKALVDPSVITANELCENAIKYGIDLSNFEKMRFELIIDDSKIRIIVTNAIKDEENLSLLKSIIDKIRSTQDKSKLYLDTIKKLLDNNKPAISQLGLLRIAAECSFDLNYQIEKNILMVIAEKDYHNESR